MPSTKVDIGFLEEKENWLLHPKFFPSKVGGKPAWLDLLHLPEPDDLLCKKCSNPLIFLCQIYAPHNESAHAFHRTVFIFVCKNGACCQTNDSSNFIVLRSQLPRKNNYYSFEPSEEIENKDFSIEKWAKLCEICGNKAPSHCAKCKKTYYCNRQHQILDWQKGHKGFCPELQVLDSYKGNNFKVTEAGQTLLIKEWELNVEEEDEKDPKNVDEKREMETLRKMMREKRAGTLDDVKEDELDQYAELVEDKVFNKFSKRVNRHPDQVLRYDRGGQPLWVTGNTNNSITNVPNCQYCGGEREFEFQIMPQLLSFVQVGPERYSIDWGVLVVYTCKTSCNQEPGYKQEYLIKQDFST